MSISSLNGPVPEDGGSIYPEYEQGNSQQAPRSSYYNRHYTDAHGNTEGTYRNRSVFPVAPC